MATYKEIKGVTLQTLDEDPVVNAGSWSSGGTMNSARTALQSGGTGNANAIVAGGYNAGSDFKTRSESYNGTSWTETSENNDARQFGGGSGTNTNAIIAGGDPSSFYTAAETWNGSAWTEAPNMNTNKNQNQLTGNATAAITAGGGNPGAINSVESWNGSAWTETSYDLNTAKKYVWMNGTTTAALIGGAPNTTESLDGTTWTEVSDTTSSHRSGASSGARDDCIVYGSDDGPGYIGNTEQWNGSSWTEVNDLGTARAYGGGTGSTPDSQTALSFGGSTPSQTGATEEWGFPPVTQAKLKEGMVFLSGGTTLKGFGKAGGIPTGSWASGGNMNTARANQSGAGAGQDSALAYGGSGPGDLTESYNGTSWSELAEINTARTEANRGLGGTQTSALYVSGSNPTGIPSNVESWNGSSWTEIAEVNSARYNNTGAIPNNTTGMIFGGENSGFKVTTEIWNGTSWTEVGDLLTPVNNSGGAGTVTASICVGGQGPPNAAINETVTWNGSSWTEVTAINRNVRGMASAGVQTSALISGGDQPPYVVSTEFWNGSSWTELNNLSTAIGNNSGGGNAANAISAGGNPGPVTAQTEEWTATNTLSTITIS